MPLSQRFLRAAILLMASCLSTRGLPTDRAGEVAAAETIYVKILVDEEERTHDHVWQTRLKERLDGASDVINQYCDLRFAVLTYGTWQSDNRLTDLDKTLREFEQEVDPSPAQIAIGFSSQYRFQKGRNGLGGTRGPMHTHILLRESATNIYERERMEALVHELGHFLGAAHSRSLSSVMRPVVGDGQARSMNFQIGFDPINARIVQLVGNEISVLGARRIAQLSQVTRERLKGDYALLVQELPQDPAANTMQKYLEQFPSGPGPKPLLVRPR